ncbi:MAG: hypothetical protein KAS53_02565 [Candidatus Cloacimonetes bacterium]|nr:hypothetical protein [Candidatus Cloacimonadota bacterium]
MGKTKQIDRRWLFILIFLGVALPLIFTIGLPLETTKNVQMVFDLIESMPKGSKALISFDYDPASMPELHPMAKALVKHCFDKDINLIFTAMWPMGVQMADDTIDQLKDDYPNLIYGEDYVNLGFKAGGMITIQSMGKNFREVFPKDMNGNNIDELPIMEGINNFSNIGFIFSLSAGAPGIKEWVQIAHDAYGRPTSGGCTGVSAPAMLPYINEQKQLTGLLAGLKAAAEYEILIKTPGTATSGMDAQSIAHLIIIIFIAIGNINYWRDKKAGKKGGK